MFNWLRNLFKRKDRSQNGEFIFSSCERESHQFWRFYKCNRPVIYICHEVIAGLADITEDEAKYIDAPVSYKVLYSRVKFPGATKHIKITLNGGYVLTCLDKDVIRLGSIPSSTLQSLLRLFGNEKDIDLYLQVIKLKG